jgi:hypothetical protein
MNKWFEGFRLGLGVHAEDPPAGGDGKGGTGGGAGAGAGADAGAGTGKEGEVVLTAMQYNALLDRLDELETESAAGGKPKGGTVDDVDDLVKDGKGGKPAGGEGLTEEQVNKLTPAQLTKLILTSVQTMNVQATQPLLVRLEEIRIGAEIKDLKKDPEIAKDFDSLKEQIFQVASRNPNLSIEEAYYLAKQKAPKKKDEGGEKQDKDVLRNLPKRRIPGEKPGGGAGGVLDATPQTRTSAAALAIEQMKKAGQL